MLRFRSDDSMNFKGFVLSYVAVDPLDDFDENSGNIDENSSEMVTPFPGYIIGQGKFAKNSEETESEEDNFLSVSFPESEDNYIYNSKKITNENVLASNVLKKKDEIGLS